MTKPIFSSCIEEVAGDQEFVRYPEYDPERELSTNTSIRGFRIGECVYEFLRPQSLRFAITESGWECEIDSLPEYHAQAESQEEAFSELAVTLHTEFQRLLTKRPFEMNEAECIAWKRLANTIDLLTYKLTKHLEFFETGCVSYGRVGRPHRIKWIDGTNYTIDVEQVPGELMACRPGQWVECVVLRDRVANRIIKIKSIRKIAVRIPTEAQVARIWNEMATGPVQHTSWE